VFQKKVQQQPSLSIITADIMPFSLRAGWICRSCRQTIKQSRRQLSTETTTQSTPPPAPPAAGFTKLPSRSLIAVYGQDAAHFLHGICTSAVPKTPSTPLGFYSAFLTGQGRLLFDTFIYPTSHSRTYRNTLPARIREKHGDQDSGYLIEVDASQALELQKHLKKYKLRAKIDLRVLDEGECDVWSIWDETSQPWTPYPSTTTPTSSATPNDLISLLDTRAPGMGQRLLLPSQNHSTSSLPDSITPLISPAASATPSSAYPLRRYLRGIPEGPAEILSGTALPAEHNIDVMSGIDFRKGCYIGQELTIRTHHTGIVRKRVLPVVLYPAAAGPTIEQSARMLEYDPAARVTLPPPGGDIKPYERPGRSAGKFVAGVGNVGLALCRVEMMTDLVLTSDGQTNFKAEDEFAVALESDVGSEGGREGGQTMIKAFVPEWMRGRIKVRAPLQRV